MFQSLSSLYGGGTGVYMQEVHVHAGTEEGAVSLGPGPMETLLEGWNEFSRKSTPGCAGIIMVYHITLTILNLTLYPLIQLEKLSFLLAMAMRFVIIKQVDEMIVFIVVLMNKEKDHSLGVGGLGCVVFCGLDIPIEGEELLRVVLNPGLTDQLVTYQPEHTWVGFHLGNLLCHGEWDLDLRESLIGGLDCLLESLCLG